MSAKPGSPAAVFPHRPTLFAGAAAVCCSRKARGPFTNAGPAGRTASATGRSLAPAPRSRGVLLLNSQNRPAPAPDPPAAPLRALQSAGSNLLHLHGRLHLHLLPPPPSRRPPPLRLLRLAAGFPGRRQPRGERALPFPLLARRHGHASRPPAQEHRPPPQGQALPQARHLRDRPGAARRGGGEGGAVRWLGGGRGGQCRHGVVRGRRDGVPGARVRARVREPAADLRRGVPQPGAGPVMVYHAAASDRAGTVTMHQVIGRLDNSAISAIGAKLAFKSNKEVSVEVSTIPLDEVVPDTERVLMIKVDVQGWEYHVLRGASKLLSRRKGEAPYLIYEEDEHLLQASNSSAQEIRAFLTNVGYNHCTRHGNDAHCTKE